jgi:hypothetical protein
MQKPVSSTNAAGKVATHVAAIGLVLCLTAGLALAKPGGGGGGGGGGHAAAGGRGGGGGGGGGPHLSAPGGGGRISHFSVSRGAGVSHFSVSRGAGVSHFSARHASGVSHFSSAHALSRSHAASASHFSARNLNRSANTSLRTNSSRASRLTSSSALTGARALTRANRAALVHAAADPAHFAARRQFASNAALHNFWGHGWNHGWNHDWHWRHNFFHIGWIGPLFWPYAYGDFFYYALWPYDYYYYDPFWAYGYGDIYEAIFSPYSYEDYVQGPRAPARMATLTQGIADSCAEEAAEVTGWPIDQIQSAVAPNQQQTALLDDLGNAVVEASHEIRTQCPASVPFTPTGRLAAMQQRLQTLVGAVNTVSPPLTKFYDSLSDEQKARFNSIAPAASAPRRGKTANPEQAALNPQAECNASVMAWPTDQIDHVVRPNDTQRDKLEALQSATGHAADMIKASCPSEVPSTPPGRLQAIGQRLEAMLHAVETVQPALADFYNALGDDQKARFNTMGKQLFAQNQ